MDDLTQLSSRLDLLEKRRTTALAEKISEKEKLERELPPSLVSLMEQIEAAASFQNAFAEIEAITTARNLLEKTSALKARWVTFVKYAESTFSRAEINLSTTTTKSFETEYRKIYERLTANPLIVPTLRKAKGSEELHLELSEFYGLKNMSAASLLPESYRNALAISIYLAAALQSKKASRFVVLDDVTSSFDAGHQFNLMQILQADIANPQNADGLQVILLSHDGLLEKHFDRMSDEVGWNHYRLEGLPPNGNVLTSKQDAQRIKTDAEKFLKAGQVAQAKPLVRQYLEYSLLRVIRKLSIPAPMDFSMRDESKTPQACVDVINEAISLHKKAGLIVLLEKQMNDWKNVCVPQLIGNFLAHYATSSGASISPHVYLSFLGYIDQAVDCFRYECKCNGKSKFVFYRDLSQKPKSCKC